MKRRAALLLMALPLIGCAASRKPAVVPYDESLRHKLAAVVKLLEGDDTGEASRLLAAICDEPGVPGVTDEALLRLALLRLGPAGEDAGASSARVLLERLRTEFPQSPWRREASSLLGLLDERGELLRADGDIKADNLVLKRENAALLRKGEELRKRLEELKHLDLELEEKSRNGP